MLRITKTAGDTTYTDPFLFKAGVVNLQIDASALTTAEVDANGYLKPGVPFTSVGVLPGASTVVYGVSVEEVKIAADNTGLAGITNDPIIAVATHATINRDIAEDNLGRAYNANELAAVTAAGSTCKLTPA
ncbi:MAG: hypothetical protein V4671_20220 [Armatimonadota bacterium]